MKKILALMMSLCLLAGLTACSGGTDENPAPSSSATAENAAPETAAENAAVVYFSATGNTEQVAQTLADKIGADLYEITPEEPYTEADLDYNTDDCRANMEQNDPDARPAIAGDALDLSGYDTIYLGFPIWWGDLPKIIYTFCESQDLSGKTIAPFCTSGGSGISQAVGTMESLAPNATITEGLRTAPESADGDLDAWLGSIA